MFEEIMEGFNQALAAIITQIAVDNLVLPFFISLIHLGQGLGKGFQPIRPRLLRDGAMNPLDTLSSQCGLQLGRIRPLRQVDTELDSAPDVGVVQDFDRWILTGRYGCETVGFHGWLQ